MNDETPIANPPLSAAERAAVAKLTREDLSIIDAAILGSCSHHWLKVARVVWNAQDSLADRYPDLSYVYYTERLADLVAQKRLESRGNIFYMRFSEVRLSS